MGPSPPVPSKSKYLSDAKVKPKVAANVMKLLLAPEPPPEDAAAASTDPYLDNPAAVKSAASAPSVAVKKEHAKGKTPTVPEKIAAVQKEAKHK